MGASKASCTLKWRRFLWAWLPVLFYCSVIFYQSSYPSPLPELPISFVDKLLHFSSYCLLGFLFARAFFSHPATRGHRGFILALSCAALYGISDEIHQSFVAARHAEIGDAVADILGSAAGAWLWMIMKSRKPGRQAKNES